jgi:hypothetical protein
VGGGLRAFNIDLPVISSLGRQALLFVVGLGFLVSAWVLREKTSGSDEATTAYRQLAIASCGRIVKIRTAELPIDVIDLSPAGVRFHKQPLIRELRRRELRRRELRRRQAGMQAELASLWTHEPPAGLRSQQRLAEDVSAQWLRRFDEQIRALQATAPDPVSETDGDVLERSGDAGLRAGVNDAMTALAGPDCPIAG